MDDPFDYTKYTLDELLDAHAHIDRSAYPERFEQLSREIEKRRADDSSEAPPAGDPSRGDG